MYYRFGRFSLFWCVSLWVVVWVLCVVDVHSLWHGWRGCFPEDCKFLWRRNGVGPVHQICSLSLQTTDAVGEGVSRASGMTGV